MNVKLPAFQFSSLKRSYSSSRAVVLHLFCAISSIFLLGSAGALAELNGLALSQKLCARCHAIDPAKPWDGIGSTPSFMLMAKKLSDYEPRIRSVGGRRPHIGQELQPSADELEAILGYIRSLKPQ